MRVAVVGPSDSVSGWTAAEVRAHMGRQRISQADLAERLGRNQQWVSRRLSGQVAFTIDELAAVADILDIDLARLIPPTEEAVRLSREQDPAGQGSFSGSDIDALIDAIDPPPHAIVA